MIFVPPKIHSHNCTRSRTPSYLFQPLMARKLSPPGEKPSTSSAYTVLITATRIIYGTTGVILPGATMSCLPADPLGEVSLSRFLSWPAVQCCRLHCPSQGLSLSPCGGHGAPVRWLALSGRNGVFLRIPYIQFSRYTPPVDGFPAPWRTFMVKL